jgi:hypothetical protein
MDTITCDLCKEVESWASKKFLESIKNNKERYIRTLEPIIQIRTHARRMDEEKEGSMTADDITLQQKDEVWCNFLGFRKPIGALGDERPFQWELVDVKSGLRREGPQGSKTGKTGASPVEVQGDDSENMDPEKDGGHWNDPAFVNQFRNFMD